MQKFSKTQKECLKINQQKILVWQDRVTDPLDLAVYDYLVFFASQPFKQFSESSIIIQNPLNINAYRAAKPNEHSFLIEHYISRA